MFYRWIFYASSALEYNSVNINRILSKNSWRRSFWIIFVSFSSLPFLINKFYFWYSLVFIATRTTTTFLAAASIQRNARFPFTVLRTIPSEGWNGEIQRFFNQIKSESTALSGMEFFFLTKRLLFGLLGALITFELVLLQFNSSDVDWESLVNCDNFKV